MDERTFTIITLTIGAFLGAFIGFGFSILKDWVVKLLNSAKLSLSIIEKESYVILRIQNKRNIAQGIFINVTSNVALKQINFWGEHFKDFSQIYTSKGHKSLYRTFDNILLSKKQTIEIMVHHNNSEIPEFIKVAVSSKNSSVVKEREVLSGEFYNKALEKIKSEGIQENDTRLKQLRFKMFREENVKGVTDMFKDIAKNGKERFDEYCKEFD